MAEPARAQANCSSELASVVKEQSRGLDGIHAAALERAVRSICDDAPH
jgi:hypothetical protein